MSEEGIVDFENFVYISWVEKLFGGIRGLLVFMAIKKNEIEQLNYQCEKASFNGMNDQELETAAIELADYLHWSNPDRMDEKKKLMLAQRLRGKYGCSKKQLARVLGIRSDMAERVLT